MLVLTRKEAEVIHIGDGIRLMVISIHGNQVRLGFDAPPEVRILRTELQGRPAVPRCQSRGAAIANCPPIASGEGTCT